MSPAPGTDVRVTDEDRAQARADVRRTSRGTTVLGLGVVVVTVLVAAVLVDVAAPHLDGFVRAVATAATAALVTGPLLTIVSAQAKAKGVRSGAETAARERAMLADGRRREFETRLANALEMADQEADALSVAERAFEQVVPGAPAELLLADNSHAHLVRVAVARSTEPPGCPVDSPQGCVAARRGQSMVFPDSEALDACPKLRERAAGRMSAVCVPVSIMGRAVGVLHATNGVGEPPADAGAVEQLQVLANQVGNRIGMLRVMAETQLQAATDGLTGLLNRRSFENELRMLRRRATGFALVMADLDEFKRVNDVHGHDVGDRALRLFAETLRTVLRPGDFVCRYGGEEFAVALPECSVPKAVEVMERVREELATVVLRGDAPSFTASFGVVDSDAEEALDALVSRADAALYRAKREGRNRVVVDGQHSADLGPLFATNGHSPHRAELPTA